MDEYQRILLIFKCVDDCLTILTKEHLTEMLRFTALAVDDPAWSETCARIESEQVSDGVECTDSAYYNMTKYISDGLDSMSDADIQIELEQVIK